MELLEFLRRYDLILTQYMVDVTGNQTIAAMLSKSALENYCEKYGTVSRPENIEFILKQYAINGLADHLTKELRAHLN